MMVVVYNPYVNGNEQARPSEVDVCRPQVKKRR
jgi:hypothetical protein